MDSQSHNSPQINLSSPQTDTQMQIENLPSTIDTNNPTTNNQEATATPLRLSTTSHGNFSENGTVQEPIVIESLQATPQQNNLASSQKNSKVFIIEDTLEQQSVIQIENPNSSASKNVHLRSVVFPDQPKSSTTEQEDSQLDEGKSSEKKSSVKKLSILSKYLSSASKTPGSVIAEENAINEVTQTQPIDVQDFAKEVIQTEQKMEIIETITTESIARAESKEVPAARQGENQSPSTDDVQENSPAKSTSQKVNNPEPHEEQEENQNQVHEMESYNIMDRPPVQNDDPYLADSNMLFGNRNHTVPCDPTTSPTKLARYNSLMSQDPGKTSARYRGEDSRGIDVQENLMAMMNADNSNVDVIVREEVHEEIEEVEEKTKVKITKVERVQTIIGNIAKESPVRSEPGDISNNKEIDAIVESIVITKETTTITQQGDNSMVIESEANYQPSLGEMVELESGKGISSGSGVKEGRGSMRQAISEEEADEKAVTQEEEVNKFDENTGIPGESEMSMEILDEERRKSEAEPLPLRHAKSPNFLEKKLKNIQEENLKSMGEFSFKKNYSKLEKEKMELAKQGEIFKPKVQQAKPQEQTAPSPFMSDAKQKFSKLQLEKMASKAKEGTQSAAQKTQPRNVSKSPVPQAPQRKVVTPNPIPSRNKANNTMNGSTVNPLKRKFDALKPANTNGPQFVQQKTSGHELKKVKITNDNLNISAFSMAESVMVTKENIPGNMNMQNMQASNAKLDTSVSKISTGSNIMPKTATAKSCVFCGDAFAKKGDTKMLSCLHKAHSNCYVQAERRKKASCPLCNSNMSPISSMYAMPKPVGYKF